VETKRDLKTQDLRNPSCTVVMYKRKSVSPVHNVLIFLLYYYDGSQNDIPLTACSVDLPTLLNLTGVHYIMSETKNTDGNTHT
jgi:hypothetical protein